MKPIAIVWFLVVGVSLFAHESTPMNIEINTSNSALRVTVINVGSEAKNVLRRLAYGTAGGPVELSFAIVSTDGKEYEYRLKARIGPPEVSDWCSLTPGQFIGREVLLDELKRAYDLPPGEYIVTATYSVKASNGSAACVLRSKPQKVKIAE